MIDIPALRYDASGLVTVVVQDATSGAVLMVAHMNEAAWRATLESGRATFYSRSRAALWEKGATSGNVMHVREARIDCDRDSVLLKVDADGPACHTGAISCFFEPVPMVSDRS